MKIACVGAGPAGLWFAICMKLAEPESDITVLERDPQGATYGWGVCFNDELFDLLFDHDPVSARQARRASVLWRGQETHLEGDVSLMGGYGYAVLRAGFLDVLSRRATQLGIRVACDHPVDDLADLADAGLADADLVVVADGAGSRLRQLHEDDFGTTIEVGRNPYIWLGTDKVFDGLVFAAESTPGGWIWLHAYPSSREVSTVVVECSEETWRWLGLDWRDEADGLQLLEKLFGQVLDGHPLISQARGEPARWLRFREVRNATWRHGNVVLIGDAAHTTHFTVGWGTRLALVDAVELIRSLREYPDDLPLALQDFDERSRPFLRRLQASARASMDWYEHADEYLAGRTAVEAAYAMATRNSRGPRRSFRRFSWDQRPPLRWVRGLRGTGRRIRRAAARGEYRWLRARRHGPRPVTRPERAPQEAPRSRTPQSTEVAGASSG